MMDEYKFCNKCSTWKHFDQFYIRSDTGKLRSHCKECMNKYTCKVTREDRAKANKASFKYQLRVRYGLTYDDYMDMVEEQENKCLICGTDGKDTKHGRLFVDHDHDTGIVGGLICHMCNIGLGNFKESEEVLESAIRYLRARHRD